VIRLHGRVVVYGEVWFDEAPPANAGVDILVYRYRRAPIANARTTPLHSLCTDLSAPPDAIAAGFHATCRSHIRRAEAKDGLHYEVIAEAADRLEEFSAFYDTFARQKALWPADRQWLARAAGGQLDALCAESVQDAQRHAGKWQQPRGRDTGIGRRPSSREWGY